MRLRLIAISGVTVVALMFLVGTLQYLPSALSDQSSVNVYWKLNPDVLEGSGPLRYVKDVALIIFGVYWPVRVLFSGQRFVIRHFVVYAIWFGLLLFFGSVSYTMGSGFAPLFIAGLRWLLIVHGAVGIANLSQIVPENRQTHSFAVKVLLGCALVDVVTVLMQFGHISFADIGAIRLPGAFPTAGTAGYFALAVGMVSRNLNGASPRLRIILFGMAVFIAATSGTRYSIMALAVIALDWFALYRPSGRTAEVQRLFGAFRAAVLFPTIVIGTVALVVFAGRGNPFDQTQAGGRLANLIDVADKIETGSTLQILFGEGLGTGTNTGFALTAGMGIPPASIDWHLLIDNTIVTTFLQLGVVGTAIFFLGCGTFVVRRRRGNIMYVLILLLGLFVQNMPEQYFLMLAFCLVLSINGKITERQQLVRFASRRELQSAYGQP